MTDIKLELEIDALLTPGETQVGQLEAAIRKALTSIKTPKLDIVPELSVGASPASRAALKAQLDKATAVLRDALAGEFDTVTKETNKAVADKLRNGNRQVMQTVKESYEKLSAMLAQPLPAKFRKATFMTEVAKVIGDPAEFDKLQAAQQKRVRQYIEYVKSQMAQVQSVLNSMNSLNRVDFGTGQLGSPITLPNLSADLRQLKEYTALLEKATALGSINSRKNAGSQMSAAELTRAKEEAGVSSRWNQMLDARSAKDFTSAKAFEQQSIRWQQDEEAKLRTKMAQERVANAKQDARWEADEIAKLRMKMSQDRVAESRKLREQEAAADAKAWQEAMARQDAANKAHAKAKAKEKRDRQAEEAAYDSWWQKALFEREQKQRTTQQNVADREEQEALDRRNKRAELRHTARMVDSVGGLGNVGQLGLGDQKLVQDTLKQQIDALTRRQRELGAAGKENTLVYERQARRLAELSDALQKSKASTAAIEKASRQTTAAINEETKAIERAADAAKEKAAREQAAVIAHGKKLVEKAGGLGRVDTIDPADQEYVGEYLKARTTELKNSQRDLIASGQQNSKLYAENRAELDKLGAAMKANTLATKDFGSASQQAGALLRQFFRYALGYGALYQALAAVTALTRGLVDLDKELYSIQAVATATEDQMTLIEGAIKKVAQQTKFSIKDISQAAKTLAQAGVKPEDMNSTLEATAAFAAATESSIEVSADLLSTMRNVFREMDDMTIANQLTRAVNISKLSADDLKTILSLSAQVASDYNLTSEQYLAAVTTLRNSGIKASTTATGLRQAILEMFSPDTKTVGALKKRYAELGENLMNEAAIRDRFNGFRDAANPLVAVLRELDRLGFNGSGKQTFGRVFDIRAENAISALIDNLQELESSAASITLGNAALTASEVQMRSLANSVENLQGAFLTLGDSLAGGALPVLEDIVDVVTDAITKFSDLNDQMRLSTGEGMGTSIGSALLGGVAGAALTRGSFLRKAGGAVAGTAAGGAMGVAAEGGADTIGTGIAAASGLMLALDMLSRARGLWKNTSNVPAVVSTAAAAVEGVGGFLSGLGKLGTLVKGIGRFSGYGTAAWIGLEIIEAVWSLFSEEVPGMKALQEKTNAARELSAKAVQEYSDVVTQLEQVRLGSAGNPAMSGTSAASLDDFYSSLRDVSVDVDTFFGKKVAEVEGLRDAVMKLAEPGNREVGSATRNALLQQISDLSGLSLDYLKKNDYQLSQFADGLRANIDAVTKMSADTQEMLRRNAETLAAGGELDAASKAMVETWERWERDATLEWKRMVGIVAATPEELLAALRQLSEESYSSGKAAIDEGREKAQKAIEDELKQLETALLLGESAEKLNQRINNIVNAKLKLGEASDKVANDVSEFLARVRNSLLNAVNDVRVGTALIDKNEGLPTAAANYFKNNPGVPEDQRNIRGYLQSRADYVPLVDERFAAGYDAKQRAEAKRRENATSQAVTSRNNLAELDQAKLTTSQRSAFDRLAALPTDQLVEKVGDKYLPTKDLKELSEALAQQRDEAAQQAQISKKLTQMVEEDYETQAALVKLDSQIAEARRQGQDVSGLLQQKKAHQLKLIDDQIAVEEAKRADANGDRIKLRESDNALAQLRLRKLQVEQQTSDEVANSSREYQNRRNELELKDLQFRKTLLDEQYANAIADGDEAKAREVVSQIKTNLEKQLAVEEEKLKRNGASAEQIDIELAERRRIAATTKLLAADLLKLRDAQLKTVQLMDTSGLSQDEQQRAYEQNSGKQASTADRMRATDDKLRALMELRAKYSADLAVAQAEKSEGVKGSEATVTAIEDRIRSLNTEIGTLTASSENLHSTFRDTWETATNVENIRARLEATAGSAQNLGQTIQDGLVNGMVSFADNMSDAILSMEGLGDTARETFSNMLRMIAQAILKQQILNATVALMGDGTSGNKGAIGGLLSMAGTAIGGMMGGGGATAGQGTVNGISSVQASRMATGSPGSVGSGIRKPSGVLAGPGTGTSDQIAALAFGQQGISPVLLSNKEAVLNARVVEQLGEETIARWNREGVRRMASGGVVGGGRDQTLRTAGGGSGDVYVNADVSVESAGDNAEDQATTGRLLKAMLEQKITQALIAEQRPGGLLNREGNRRY